MLLCKDSARCRFLQKNTVSRHYWRHIFQSEKFESHAKIDRARVDQIEPILD